MFLQSLNGSWQFRKSGDSEWSPASVPGGVHTDLLALGQIPDPFVSDNEKKVQWIAEHDWEYRCTFKPALELLEQARQLLVCDGLDTLAEVSLNGQLLGKTDNMFRRWSWEVNDFLRSGENEITILFRAPVSFIKARQAEKPMIGGGDIPGGPHLRKASSQWGWDWGPKLPPIGIWKGIRLEGYSKARLIDVHVRQRTVDPVIDGETRQATLSVDSFVEDLAAASLRVDCRLYAPDGSLVSQGVTQVEPGSKNNLELGIPEPQWWWPNGYGSQPLYRLDVTLKDSAEANETCDQRTYQIGLRSVKVRREPDQWGECFTFVVNGVPIFAKGADWIPADSFPTRISDDQLEWLIQSAALAHMNMLRVWGGGFYEEERFYDLCDRYGILVWQDFTFACGIYPDDDAFAENVHQEAIENVRRLRHRASLALWCGNNEMEQGWVDWGWNKPSEPANQRLKAGYDRLFHQLLPAVVAEEDPDRLYWPSSASSGIPFSEPNGQLRGDTHYWDVWHGRKPFTAYRSQYPRFMSEFGFQALPPFKTIQTYAEPNQQNMTSYVMEHHQRSGSGNGLMVAQMTNTFRMPKDFRSLVYLSMILQAEGIRYGVEHWRRNMNRVSGTLIWQLNDCWPVASWSSLDYFGRWKALHYAARRFYAPMLLSVEDNASQMAVHITSDLTQPWVGMVRWRLDTIDGRTIASDTLRVNSPPLADTLVCDLDFSDRIHEGNIRSVVFICELWQDAQFISRQLVTFAPIKHLELEEPGLQAEVSQQGERIIIDVSSRSLALFVELSLEGADVVFSDNYFDLPAGSTIQITAPCPDGWNLEQAKKALHMVSLFDSYD